SSSINVKAERCFISCPQLSSSRTKQPCRHIPACARADMRGTGAWPGTAAIKYAVIARGGRATRRGCAFQATPGERMTASATSAGNQSAGEQARRGNRWGVRKGQGDNIAVGDSISNCWQGRCLNTREGQHDCTGTDPQGSQPLAAQGRH